MSNILRKILQQHLNMNQQPTKQLVSTQSPMDIQLHKRHFLPHRRHRQHHVIVIEQQVKINTNYRHNKFIQSPR